MLQDMGYDVTPPETFGTFHAMLDGSGMLTIQGGNDDTEIDNVNQGASADNISVSRVGNELVVSVDVGVDVPGTGSGQTANDQQPAFVSRFNVADVDGIRVHGLGGNDTITFAGNLGFISDDIFAYGGDGERHHLRLRRHQRARRAPRRRRQRLPHRHRRRRRPPRRRGQRHRLAAAPATTTCSATPGTTCYGAGAGTTTSSPATATTPPMAAPATTTLLGGDGNDLLAGEIGNDTCYGNQGRDTIVGGSILSVARSVPTRRRRRRPLRATRTTT